MFRGFGLFGLDGPGWSSLLHQSDNSSFNEKSLISSSCIWRAAAPLVVVHVSNSASTYQIRLQSSLSCFDQVTASYLTKLVFHTIWVNGAFVFFQEDFVLWVYKSLLLRHWHVAPLQEVLVSYALFFMLCAFVLPHSLVLESAPTTRSSCQICIIAWVFVMLRNNLAQGR